MLLFAVPLVLLCCCACGGFFVPARACVPDGRVAPADPAEALRSRSNSSSTAEQQPQQSSSAMAASTADALVLRVEIPTFGIQTRQTKKFRPTATVDEVLTTLKTTLHPCLSHPHCAKHASSGRRKQHEAAHKPRAGHALTIVCLRFPVFLCQHPHPALLTPLTRPLAPLSLTFFSFSSPLPSHRLRARRFF